MTAAFNSLVFDGMPFDGPGTAPSAATTLLAYVDPRKASLVEDAADAATVDPRLASLVEDAADIATVNPRLASLIQ